MPQWITPAGFLVTATKGEPFLLSLSCNTGNLLTTFTTIAGSLPLGLSLSGPGNGQIYPLPSLWGTIDPNCPTGNTTFTIRASNSTGVQDRAFTISVTDPEPSYVFPDSDLGFFIDGKYAITSVAPTTPVAELMGNISVVAGSMPGNVTLDPNTGIISGYINPADLYNTPPIFPNMEMGAPNLPGSANSAVFNFTVQYTANNSVGYSMTVLRADLFN